MIWNKEKECMERKDLEKLQLERLQKILQYTYENVPYYKEKFDELNIKIEDIQTLEDITKLPFTTKDDLRKTYPFGLQAASKDDIVEIHSTSGTTGIPTVIGYTKKDIDTWGEIMARSLTMVGTQKHDIVQNSYGYGLFTGGMGAHYGGQKIGAIVVPTSSGNTQRQISIIKDFKTNVLTCTPSYALYLAEALEQDETINIEDLDLKGGVFGAEMWTEEMREKIEEKLNITAQNVYGLTEVMGPGVAMECKQKDGLHIAEDFFYPEIINPKTLEPVKDGEKGELVITTLTKEGMPVIRFRTKDITSITKETCECGRTTARISRITGRSDDMLKVKGVIVFPSQIESTLLKIDGLEPHYQIIVTRPETLDEMEVQVETKPELFTDSIKVLEKLKQEISHKIHDSIGLRVKVTLSEPNSLPRSEGKATRVIDKRNFE
ncbi:MAG: phenylacetate--CoA ligase [Methanobacteriaceae archaeon]|nr:phenylacetate--CoA ligase [Methanobacteriaceae archaeon]